MVTIHLVDGTYDLYRMYYGSPKVQNKTGREIGASRSFLYYLYRLVKLGEVTHIGVAFSTVIDSFRNAYLVSYKTSARVPTDLFEQFLLVEEITRALGITCWGMIEYEADDAIATAAVTLADVDEVEKVIILSPDKDFAQLIGPKVIMEDRVRNRVFDYQGVINKWGVQPVSIPDYLGLMGDKADGIPGIPKWGAKSASTILAKFTHIENIPADPTMWGVRIRGKASLSQSLNKHREQAVLYRMIATLKTDLDIECGVESLGWKGAAKKSLGKVCEILEMPEFIDKIEKWI